MVVRIYQEFHRFETRKDKDDLNVKASKLSFIEYPWNREKVEKSGYSLAKLIKKAVKYSRWELVSDDPTTIKDSPFSDEIKRQPSKWFVERQSYESLEYHICVKHPHSSLVGSDVFIPVASFLPLAQEIKQFSFSSHSRQYLQDAMKNMLEKLQENDDAHFFEKVWRDKQTIDCFYDAMRHERDRYFFEFAKSK